jgi:CheY-like chemotaxis protein
MIHRMPKILLIDDEPRIARALEFALGGTDFSVEALSSSDGLAQHLEATRPDAILLDIALGRENGLEVCRMLKNDERFRAIPLLLLRVRPTRRLRKPASTRARMTLFGSRSFRPS